MYKKIGNQKKWKVNKWALFLTHLRCDVTKLLIAIKIQNSK